MRVPFGAREGLIIVPAELFGPFGSAVVRLAVGTGATSTVINALGRPVEGSDKRGICRPGELAAAVHDRRGSLLQLAST